MKANKGGLPLEMLQSHFYKGMVALGPNKVPLVFARAFPRQRLTLETFERRIKIDP